MDLLVRALAADEPAQLMSRLTPSLKKNTPLIESLGRRLDREAGGRTKDGGWENVGTRK